MPIYEYQCKKCNTIQEKFHKMVETNTEPCQNTDCNAPPEELKKILSPIDRHMSWSKWSV